MNLSTIDLFKNLKNVEGTVEVSGENLRKLQRCLLGILHDIDSVCKEHNIPYYLGGGNALGAIRHQGFIPWDDDIDLNITHKDFITFAEVFKKKYGEKYTVQIPGETPDYTLLQGRVRLNGTVYRTRDDLPQDQNIGIFVDFSIVENTFDSAILRKTHGFFCLAFGFATSCRLFFEQRVLYKKLLSNSPEGQKVFLVKSTIGFFLSFLTAHCWAKATNKVYSLSNNNQSFWVSVPGGRKHYFGEMYKREDFLTPKHVKFEDLDCSVPIAIDEYLTSLYGSTYMTPPPQDSREAHIVFGLKLPDESS